MCTCVYDSKLHINFMCTYIYINRSNIIHIAMEIPASKRRRIRVPLPKVCTFVWDSPFNMEGKIAISNEELGDGATSRVYVGTIEGVWCRNYKPFQRVLCAFYTIVNEGSKTSKPITIISRLPDFYGDSQVNTRQF